MTLLWLSLIVVAFQLGFVAAAAIVRSNEKSRASAPPRCTLPRDIEDGWIHRN